MTRTRSTTARYLAPITAAAGGWALLIPPVRAAVDVLLVPSASVVDLGAEFEVFLVIASDNDVNEAVVAMDVLLAWDPGVVQLIGSVNKGPYGWLLSGFLPDGELDGLNDTFADGNAMYTALSQPTFPALATQDGLVVTALRFIARAASPVATVSVVREMGTYSSTRVFGPSSVARDITGELGFASLRVKAPTSLRMADESALPGRREELVVWGSIDGESTYAVTVLLEIVPREGAEGMVAFTEAPPVDIAPLGDPWPGAGLFMVFDTDSAGSTAFNGIVDDNGMLTPASTTFAGPLASFPIEISEDARGVWDVLLATSVGNSGWEELETTLRSGVLRVVEPGDVNGDGRVDLLDVQNVQNCYFTTEEDLFTPEDNRVSCGALDFDDDGDMDRSDYAVFSGLMSGPSVN